MNEKYKTFTIRLTSKKHDLVKFLCNVTKTSINEYINKLIDKDLKNHKDIVQKYLDIIKSLN